MSTQKEPAMSKMSTLHVMILERVERGEMPADIAHALDIPTSWVYEAMETMEEFSQYATINS
jgi:hypothetical protein